MSVNAKLPLVLAVFAGSPMALRAGGPAQGQPKKIVFIAGENGHHPNQPTIRLLRACLDASPDAEGVSTEYHFVWPQQPSTLDDSAAIVVMSEGPNKKGMEHPIFQGDRTGSMDKLMRKGVGLVCIHYTLYATQEIQAPKLLAWLGAYYDFQGYGSSHGVSRKPLACTPATPEHPICRGWQRFSVAQNEFYHDLRFASGGGRITPILTAPFRTEKPDGQVVAWAFERADGGRAFGFGGGHFYENLAVDPLRTMLLNAILWVAKVDVPPRGVRSVIPAELAPASKPRAPH